MVDWFNRFRRKPVEATRVKVYAKEDQGTVDVQTRWTDKQPHPTRMSQYEDTLDDAEVSIAINLLADMIAPSYYTEMPEGVKPDHPNKKLIDEYGETVNLDEDLQTIVRVMLGKGFCPVERLSNYDLKILPPETFYIWKNKKGKLLKYTQEVNGATVATWKSPRDMETVIPFVNNEDPTHPYGKALVDPIVDLIAGRKKMNEDMVAVIHRYGYPTGVLTTSKGRAAIQKEFEEKDPDEWIFIGNVLKDEVNWDIITVDPRATWINYIELIYYQICEALHAPLLLYLKNATEASANVMLESVDRYVQGIQRYIKRRVEKYLFEPQCSEPVPRLVWGQPKTGLEEIELADVANLYSTGAVKFNQVQDLLKKLGMDLIEPEEEVSPPPEKQLPFQKPAPMPPLEAILDKMNDLTTSLNIIETNYREKRLPLIKAMRMGGKAIDVYTKRMYPKNDKMFREKRDLRYMQWARRLIVVKEASTVYKVSVSD